MHDVTDHARYTLATCSTDNTLALDTISHQGFMRYSQVVNYQPSKALQSYQIATWLQEQCSCVVSATCDH